MRKMIFILFTVFLLTVFTACGSSAPANTASGNSGKEKVELLFWDTLFRQDDSTPKDQWFVKQAIQKFEAENPNITIKWVLQPEDIQKYDNLLRAAGIAKNGPDVATQFAGGPVLSFAQFLEPLDGYFQDELNTLVGWESVREDFKADGKILAVPYGAGSYFEVFYNKDIFKKAGIENFTPPETWEQFLELCQKIKTAGFLPVTIGEQEGYTGAWVMATLVGGKIGTNGFFDMRTGKLPMTDESMTAGYKAYQQLYALGLTNKDAASKTNGEGNDMFYQGKGAMLIGGGWLNKDVYDALKDNAGNFPIPTLAGAEHAGGIAGGPNVSLAISNYSKHKEEAVKFIQFMIRPDILDLYVKIKQTEPSNHKDADLNVINNPLLKNQADWLKKQNTIYPFDNIMDQTVNDLYYRMNAQVFVGKATPENAAEELQKANEKVLKMKK